MEKQYFLFTDSNPPPFRQVIHIPKVRRGFPIDPLHQYHYIMEVKEQVETLGSDLCYYLDVDSQVVAKIGRAFLPTPEQPLIAVSHPGYYDGVRGIPSSNPSLPFERREASTACVSRREKTPQYVCGAVQGGFTNAFFEASQSMRHSVDSDNQRGIIAIYHDESHWNRYVLSHPDRVKILPPDYCYPIEYARRLRHCRPKIVAIKKDHDFFRLHIPVKDTIKPTKTLIDYIPPRLRVLTLKFTPRIRTIIKRLRNNKILRTLVLKIRGER